MLINGPETNNVRELNGQRGRSEVVSFADDK